MVSLEGTRTNANPKHAFSEEGRCDRRYLNQESAAEAGGFPGLATLSRAMAGNGVRFANGHLAFEAADVDRVTPPGMSPSDFAAEMTTMTDDHTGMYAGKPRTARHEGFAEIADWFKSLAKAGRSRARLSRQVLDKYRSTEATCTMAVKIDRMAKAHGAQYNRRQHERSYAAPAASRTQTSNHEDGSTLADHGYQGG